MLMWILEVSSNLSSCSANKKQSQAYPNDPTSQSHGKYEIEKSHV